MLKIIPPRAWGFDGPQVEIVKTASAGFRGADLAEFVKRASHPLADWVRHNRPQPGEVWTHSIALGSTETAGPNRNNDGYPYTMLERDHPTFEKYARFYRNHLNKRPEISYGVIKKAYYDRELGRVEIITALNATKEAARRNGGLVADRELEKLAANHDIAVSQSVRVPYDECFVAGTPVETEAGPVAIEEIKTGDRVKTHTGRWSAVAQLHRQTYSGDLCGFTVIGLPTVAWSTPNHPYYVVRSETLRSCHGSTSGGRRRRHTFVAGVCKTCGLCTDSVEPMWVAAGDVRPDDYLVYPRPDSGSAGSTDFGYVLGAYLGNGSLVKQRRGRDKQGEHYTVGVNWCYGRHWTEVTDRLGEAVAGVTTKRLAKYASGAGRDADQYVVRDRELARMLVQCGGEYSGRKQLASEVDAWTAEAKAAVIGGLIDADGAVDPKRGTVRITLVNLGVLQGIQRLCWSLGCTAALNSYVASAGYGRPRRVYQLSLGRRSVERLRPYSAKIAATAVRPFKFLTDHQVVTDRWLLLPVKTVMRRNVTAESVFNFHVPGDESYVAGGVVTHNCSSCGHQAKTRAEYCTPEMCKYGGCRDHLGRVFDDGTHLFVQNPQGVFFDLSNVSDTRGADRTAFITGKVAAGHVPGGAELAEQLGMVVPDYLIDPHTLTAMSCLRKLAAVRSIDPVLTWDEAVTERRKSAAYTPDPVFPSYDAGAHAVLAELAGDGVVLPPAAWLAAVTGAPGEKCAAVFPTTLDPQRLLDRPDVHDLLASTSFGDNRLSTGRFAWLSPTVKGLSKEAALGVLFSRQPAAKTASISSVPLHIRDEAEARYLAYQAGCLARHENSAKFGLLLSECAAHNRRP